ncbi:TRAP transporter substrate-binding protein [Plastorhodobacter daqingensis]|uniref:TRAP transporter substrate-binding protein n=1 Tax=Plastorhodobacter daqingensis TaxID=1387281 RepID=A0ABW2UJE0_9RHOB
MTIKQLALVGVLALSTALPAGAADVELTLSHWVPGTHPLHVTGMEPWAESIRDASNGRIEITIYPAQQLGNAADHYDMARDMVVDIGFINPGYQPGRFPILAAGELPFMFSNAVSGSRALHEWYAQYAEQEMADVHVCMVHLHDPGTLHSKTGPLLVPEDLRGKNIRPAHATMARLVSALGGASVQVPAPEIRELLSKGAADMTASPWGSVFTFGLEDAVTHHLDMPFYATTFAFVMNKTVVDGLSPEDREVIDAHCSPEWSERIATEWAAYEAAGRERLLATEDHTFHTPDAAQIQLWKAAGAPLTDEWKRAVSAAGHDADAIYESFIETLRRHNALVE